MTRNEGQFIDLIYMKSLQEVRLDSSLLDVQEVSFLYEALCSPTQRFVASLSCIRIAITACGAYGKLSLFHRGV